MYVEGRKGVQNTVVTCSPTLRPTKRRRGGEKGYLPVQVVCGCRGEDCIEHGLGRRRIYVQAPGTSANEACVMIFDVFVGSGVFGLWMDAPVKEMLIWKLQ